MSSDHVSIPVNGSAAAVTANGGTAPRREPRLNWSPRVAEGNAIASVLAPKKSPSQLNLAALEVDPAWLESARIAQEQLAATTGASGVTSDDLSFGWQADPHLRQPAGAGAVAASQQFGVDLAPLGGSSIRAAGTPTAAAVVASGRSTAAPVAAAGTHDKPIALDLKRGGTLVLPAPLATPAPGSGHGHVHNDGQLAARGSVAVGVTAAGAGDSKHGAGAAAGAVEAVPASIGVPSDGHGHSGYNKKRPAGAGAAPKPGAAKADGKSGGSKFTETEEILMKMSNLTGQACVDEVKSTLCGITKEESAARLAAVGLNKLLADAPLQWWKFLWTAFLHPFNVLLLALAVVNGAIENYVSFGILCGMVFLSVLMRFWQEWKSALSAESLKRRITRLVRVRRPDGQGGFVHEQIEHEKVVPGEVVELAAGDLIAGDVRVLESHNLLVNQSILTGESVPIEKTVAPAPDPNADQLTRTNLSFMGSTVETGSGVVVVLLTGPRTYFGQNAKMLTADRNESAFAKGVRGVSYTLVSFMAVMVPIVFIVSGVVQDDWAQAGLFAIAVAVGMTPEMLPMIVNSNLSLGAAKMARHKCVVKRLEAIQNIGAMDVLCTDKTGTLTMDRVQVHSALDVAGNASAIPLAQSYIIAFHQKGFRNVLDNAIVSAVEDKPLAEHGSPTRAPGEHKDEEHIKVEEKMSPEQEAHARVVKGLFDGARAMSSGIGQTRAHKVAELPFDFFRRRMSVVATVNPATDAGVPQGVVARMYTKGAMDEMVPICSHIADCSSGAAVARPMSVADRQGVLKLLERLNTDGLRVLAVAYKDFTDLGVAQSVDNKAEQGLVLCGLLTFLDPPKPDTHAVLARMAALNVQVKVLTGDNILVAKKVCATIGIDVTHTLTGDQMRELTMDDDDEDVYRLFARTTVFARLSPTQKERVIRVLRNNKFHPHVVGMLGDGVNDALALKEADCGVSVDTGSDLAKDAAAMILTEKSLDVLHHGIVTGRRVHGNTIKYIKMTASSNFGNVFSLLIASAWLPFLPMQPVQLLLGNIIYDVSQLAIPWDQMDDEYLEKPKTWSAGGLVRFMIWLGPTSSIFDIVTFLFAFYVYGYNDGDADAYPDDVKYFNSMWFLEGLITQTLIVHMIRTRKVPFFQSRAHWIVCCTTVLCVGMAIVLNLVPDISDALDMKPVPGSYFGFLAVCMLAYSVVVQFVKTAYIRYYAGEWL